VIARQGLERHPGAAAADVFVGGWLLTKEAHAPPTKTQPVQDGYSGKPARPPKIIEFTIKECGLELHPKSTSNR